MILRVPFGAPFRVPFGLGVNPLKLRHCSVVPFVPLGLGMLAAPLRPIFQIDIAASRTMAIYVPLFRYVFNQGGGSNGTWNDPANVPKLAGTILLLLLTFLSSHRASNRPLLASLVAYQVNHDPSERSSPPRNAA